MTIIRFRHTGLARFFSTGRVTFRFEGADATDVEYEDYH